MYDCQQLADYFGLPYGIVRHLLATHARPKATFGCHKLYDRDVIKTLKPWAELSKKRAERKAARKAAHNG